MPRFLYPMLLIPALSAAVPEWVADPFETPPHAVAAGGGVGYAQTSFSILVEENGEAISSNLPRYRPEARPHAGAARWYSPDGRRLPPKSRRPVFPR